MSSSNAQDQRAGSEPDLFVHNNDKDVRAGKAEQVGAVDLTDSPDEVLLSKSGIWCKPDEILQAIQTEYANNLEKIASNIKPGNLQTRLESFASKARSVNKAGFIKGYTTGWAQAVTQAATEATTRKEKREKILEEIEKDGFPDETAGFEDGLMEKAQKRFKIISKCKTLTENLFLDLKKHVLERSRACGSL